MTKAGNATTTRRGALATLAAGAAAATAAPGLALADADDAALVALGAKIEPLVLEHWDTFFVWAPRTTAADHLRAGSENWWRMTEDESQKHMDALEDFLDANGASAADDRLYALHKQIEPLADAIKAAPARTLAGLRAKALVVLYEAQPDDPDHDGELYMVSDEQDCGAGRALFYAVADLTGLTPVVRELEARLRADAAGRADDDDDQEAQS